MTWSVEHLTEELRAQRFIAIVRNADADPAELVRISRRLQQAGASLVELPLTSRGALKAIRVLNESGAAIGAGTVVTVDQVDAVVAAGAAFVVTPSANAEVAARAHGLQIPFVMGAMSPTEIVAAAAFGSVAVKVFPAGPLGPAYIAALRGPFPDVPLVPTGGISVADAHLYLRAGALAVGLGSDLVGDGTAEWLGDQVAAFRATMP